MIAPPVPEELAKLKNQFRAVLTKDVSNPAVCFDSGFHCLYRLLATNPKLFRQFEVVDEMITSMEGLEYEIPELFQNLALDEVIRPFALDDEGPNEP